MPTILWPVTGWCRDLHSGLSVCKVTSLERPQHSCQEVRRALASVSPFLLFAISHGSDFWVGRGLGQFILSTPLSLGRSVNFGRS